MADPTIAAIAESAFEWVYLIGGCIATLCFAIYLVRWADWCLPNPGASRNVSEWQRVRREAKTMRNSGKFKEAERLQAAHVTGLIAKQFELSKKKCEEFVGADGHGSHHLGAYTEMYYLLNTTRERGDTETVTFDQYYREVPKARDMKKQWEQLVQRRLHAAWRTAVYLLRMTQKKVAAQIAERQKWAEAARENREQDRERRVNEWVGREKLRITEGRPKINLRNIAKWSP